MTLAITPDQYAAESFDPSIRGSGSTIVWNPLFWVGFATAGSAFIYLRFELAGMAFHPYMAILGLLFFRAVTRIHTFPARIGRPGVLFLLLYITSLIQGHSFLIQLTKISVMAVTLLIITVSVRSYDDFIAGAIGLGMGASLLCIRGIFRGLTNFGSINPIDGSQKNAFSLFYLPALTLCLYLIFSGRLSISRRTLVAIMITLISAAIFLSKNRSGWLTSGVLLLLVFGTNRQRLRITAFLVIVTGLAFVVADIVTSKADVFYERDAINAAQSDRLRLELILSALTIGLQHPLLGVSPSRLTRMLGAIEKVDEQGIDCHNLTSYLIGGCGLFTFAAYCLFAFAMLRPPRRFSASSPDPFAIQSARILSTMTVIWIIRSQFQEDVLFSATFTMGLGLCIGLCIVCGVYDSGLDANHDLFAHSAQEASGA
jgi:O-Antigen ligase